LVPFTDGSSLTVNSPIWISGQQKTKPRPAPSVGEHSEEVLREAGYTDTEIHAPRAEGVIAELQKIAGPVAETGSPMLYRFTRS
jgi:formyl-CoA transferase